MNGLIGNKIWDIVLDASETCLSGYLFWKKQLTIDNPEANDLRDIPSWESRLQGDLINHADNFTINYSLKIIAA